MIGAPTFMDKFTINETFINQYKDRQPNWGPIGYITYKRTYARPLDNGHAEEYWQTIQRVINGVFNIQKRHAVQNRLPWKEDKAQEHAQAMYRKMWEFKFTPPGRGLWMMGTDYVEARGGAALNNCAFVSTENICDNFAEPFCFLMDMSMLGVGVGGDTKGADTLLIREPVKSLEDHVVEDTREGWIKVLERTLNAYAGKDTLPKSFDYSKVRPFGTQIKGFGGIASGPGPLDEMTQSIQTLLNTRVNK